MIEARSGLETMKDVFDGPFPRNFRDFFLDPHPICSLILPMKTTITAHYAAEAANIRLRAFVRIDIATENERVNTMWIPKVLNVDCFPIIVILQRMITGITRSITIAKVINMLIKVSSYFI